MSKLAILWKLWRKWEEIINRWKEIERMDKPLVLSKTVWGGILFALSVALQQVADQLQDGNFDWSKVILIIAQMAATMLGVIGGRDILGKIAAR